MTYICTHTPAYTIHRNSAEAKLAVDILQRLKSEFAVDVAARAVIITFYNYQVNTHVSCGFFGDGTETSTCYCAYTDGQTCTSASQRERRAVATTGTEPVHANIYAFLYVFMYMSLIASHTYTSGKNTPHT